MHDFLKTKKNGSAPLIVVGRVGSRVASRVDGVARVETSLVGNLGVLAGEVVQLGVEDGGGLGNSGVLMVVIGGELAGLLNVMGELVELLGSLNFKSVLGGLKLLAASSGDEEESDKDLQNK